MTEFVKADVPSGARTRCCGATKAQFEKGIRRMKRPENHSSPNVRKKPDKPKTDPNVSDFVCDVCGVVYKRK